MANRGEEVLNQVMLIFLHNELVRVDNILEDGHISYKNWTFYHQYGDAIVSKINKLKGLLEWINE